jgi:hypothetical protein
LWVRRSRRRARSPLCKKKQAVQSCCTFCGRHGRQPLCYASVGEFVGECNP